MTISLVDAKLIMEAPKRLVGARPWVPHPSRGAEMQLHVFEARIEIDGVLPRGVWFRSTVFARHPETLTFQLDCEQPGSRSHIPLYRLDVKPLGGHLNGQFGPPELRGQFFMPGETHEHICFYHVVDSEERIRTGGVQTARKIEAEFRNFDEALTYTCAILQITNPETVPPPNIQGSLF